MKVDEKKSFEQVHRDIETLSELLPSAMTAYQSELKLELLSYQWSRLGKGLDDPLSWSMVSVHRERIMNLLDLIKEKLNELDLAFEDEMKQKEL